MHWIIENFTKESSYEEIIKEVQNQGHELTIIKNGYKHSDINHLREGNPCVLFLGSIEMTNIIKKELSNCFPVAFCNQEKYLCTNYMTYFGKYLFNDRYAIISLSELQRQKFFYYGVYGKEALIFIRPNSGQKPFQAQLLDMLDIDRFVKTNEHIKHELVVVSTPKNIRWEGRFVVTNEKEIIAHSTYLFQGQITKIPTVPKESIDLVKNILEIGYYPDKVFVIDICQDNDGNFWLMELNSFSSAGMYATDKKVLVKRLSEIAEKEYYLYRH